jgi:hypothetical protein
MATPEALKAKYPTSNCPPDPNCKSCKGEGEKWNPSTGRFIKPAFVPCMCIFVSHDFAPIAREALSETVKKLKAELESE